MAFYGRASALVNACCLGWCVTRALCGLCLYQLYPVSAFGEFKTPVLLTRMRGAANHEKGGIASWPDRLILSRVADWPFQGQVNFYVIQTRWEKGWNTRTSSSLRKKGDLVVGSCCRRPTGRDGF